MVSCFFLNFHPAKLGKIPILTHMFQRGWFNRQLVFLVKMSLFCFSVWEWWNEWSELDNLSLIFWGDDCHDDFLLESYKSGPKNARNICIYIYQFSLVGIIYVEFPWYRSCMILVST